MDWSHRSEDTPHPMAMPPVFAMIGCVQNVLVVLEASNRLHPMLVTGEEWKGLEKDGIIGRTRSIRWKIPALACSGEM